MQKVVHKADSRGGADHGWLKTRHSFSFADWYEPKRMGFGKLRVLNDDFVAPSSGFDPHPHREMEIVTIVTGGEVTHEDSAGNKGVTKAGDVQVMSAGTGVLHSERNASETESLSLFQLWIESKERGVAARYDQHTFPKIQQGIFELLVGPKGSGAPLWIYQDAYISRALFDRDLSLTYTLKGKNLGIYLFVISGQLLVSGESLFERDALGVWETEEVRITATQRSEFLILEVPMR